MSTYSPAELAERLIASRLSPIGKIDAKYLGAYHTADGRQLAVNRVNRTICLWSEPTEGLSADLSAFRIRRYAASEPRISTLDANAPRLAPGNDADYWQFPDLGALARFLDCYIKMEPDSPMTLTDSQSAGGAAPATEIRESIVRQHNYRSATIAEVLPRLNHDLFIPGIQRPFVWEPEQITRLFDSLMQGFPISSFLFWQVDPENRADWEIYRFIRHFTCGDIHNEHAELPDDQPAVLVLDGQQRLTSILIGLEGTYTTKLKHKRKKSTDAWRTQVLYIDLAYDAIGSADDEESAPIGLRHRFQFFDEEKRPEASAETAWFRVGNVLASATTAQRDELVANWVDRNSTLAANRRDTARATVLRLWETVFRDDCIAYYVERSQSYDKVLDIFIRANEGGTKLSRSDLLMSVITLRWQRFNARDETEALLAELTRIAEPMRALEREFLLRACLYLCDLDFGFKVANFSPANIGRIEEQWLRIKAALTTAAQTLRRVGLYGEQLASHNVLMLVGYYVFRSNRQRALEAFVVAAEDAERLRRWVIAFVFSGALSTQTLRTFSVARTSMRSALLGSTHFPAEALVRSLSALGRPIALEGEAVDRLLAHPLADRAGPGLLSLVYGCDLAAAHRRPIELVQARFVTTEYLRTAGVPDSVVSLVQAMQRQVGMAIALTDSEREAYYGRDFEDWLASRSDEFLAEHCLPTDRSLFRLDRLLELGQHRGELIKARLGALFAEQVS